MVVITAAANRLARVAWAVLSSGEEYHTDSLGALLNRRGKDAFSLEAQNRPPLYRAAAKTI
jgi:hypothetical protein